MKDITLTELERQRQICISDIKQAIQTFKNNTGILTATVQMNGIQTTDKKGVNEITYSPSIDIRL